MTTNIELQQPRPFDLVGNHILVAGQAVGFEGLVQVEVSDGHTVLSAVAGAGSLGKRQFQTFVDVPSEGTFQQSLVFVTVKDEGGGGEGSVPSVTIPVVYANFFFETYLGFRDYTVQPGDTLSSIAAARLGDAALFTTLHLANPHIIADPNVIFPGQVIRIPIE